MGSWQTERSEASRLGPLAGAQGDASPRVMIIGIGSPLRGDDAVGPAVVERLQAEGGLPPEVQVMDAGLCGVDLVWLVQQAPHTVLVDAADFGGEPGELRLFRWEELRTRAQRPFRGGHGVDVLQALGLAEALGERPEVLLVGIQVASTQLGAELSGALARNLAAYAETVRNQALRLTRLPESAGPPAGGAERRHAEKECEPDGQDPGR